MIFSQFAFKEIDLDKIKEKLEKRHNGEVDSALRRIEDHREKRVKKQKQRLKDKVLNEKGLKFKDNYLDKRSLKLADDIYLLNALIGEQKYYKENNIPKEDWLPEHSKGEIPTPNRKYTKKSPYWTKKKLGLLAGGLVGASGLGYLTYKALKNKNNGR